MNKAKTILLLAANPKDTNRLRLDEEAREIDEGLRRSKNRQKFDLVQRWAVRIQDLRRSILDYDPQIIHFIGHGEPEGILLEDESGKVVTVNPDALSSFFEILAGNVECVIMNACYSESHAKAIGKHVPYVIGIRREIGDKAAIEFFIGFYDGIGVGKSIEQSFRLGCNAIRLKNIPEHLTPILQKTSDLKLPSVWNVPHLRNPNFTGREEIFTKIRKALTSGKPAMLTQVITGLGGIGKTQIAIEYVYRYTAEYKVVWWLRAENSETLAADYINLAQSINLPEKDSQEQQIIIENVRRWLEQNQNWLLIFDNTQTPEDIYPYLPRVATGHVLVTSRHHTWDGIGKSLVVDSLNRKESTAFLLKRTLQKDSTTANHLAEALGDLPLALEQAAAYINSVRISFKEYLELFQVRRQELWKKEAPPLGYPDTMATTWRIAIQKVKEDVPVGANILNFCAFLAGYEIPRSLLDKANEHLPASLSKKLKDHLEINKGIRELQQYSMVQVIHDTLSVHPLIQIVTRDHLKEDEKKLWIKAAVGTIDSIFPTDGYENVESWQKCTTFLPHARTTIEHADYYKIEPLKVCNLLNKIGMFLVGRAAYSESEMLFRKALEIAENQIGKEHAYVASSLNNLGKLLKNQGRFVESEPYFTEALKIRNQLLGHNHLDIANNLNDLGMVLQAQGKYTQAEPLFRETIKILELHLGKEQPEISKSLNNLALLLKYQGKYVEAEKLFYQALKIREKHLGNDHPDVANSLNNLAGLLQAQGKYAEAEKFFQKALKIYETRLGAEQVSITFDYVRINSELERRALELEKANEELKELDRKKSEFLSTVSHELRTPLTPIKGCLEGMLKERYGNINEKQRNRLEVALASVNDEVRLIENLLDLVRIQENRVTLELEAGSVKEIIYNVYQLFEYDAKNKDLTLILEISDKDLLNTQLDKGKTKQIIINLVYNAIKFTPTGGRITISASKEDRFIKITVSDTGCGINEDQLEKIFERFYQIDSSSTRKVGGTGIGLSIVKEFVELHGGEISVESKPGEGSIFTFTLPLRDGI